MIQYVLREMTNNDQNFMYELINKYLKMDLSVTVLTIKSINEYFQVYNSNDLKTYIIIIDNERAGFVHITKDGEIGYYITKKFEGKGIATNAVKDMLKLEHVKKCFATVNIKNIRSNNLVKGLGFSQKGIIYEKIIDKEF